MEASPNPNKRLCENHNSIPNVPNYNKNHVDLIVSSFLLLPDSPSLSSPLSISCSFDQALEKFFEASGDDSVQDRLTDRSLQLATLLQESTKRCYRKRATLRNSNSWSLPHELTVKVFSMLDTKSLMQASACCTMFKKCAMDPLCYSHIDLTTTGNVSSRVVRSMIRHAGKELRSLKVGRKKSLLTGSCLDSLSSNQGFSGNLLECLHIYNHKWLDYNSLRNALSACSNLTDLKIVGLNIDPLDKVLESLTRKCEHLFIENEIAPVLYHATRFAKDFPNITSLSLIVFKLFDLEVYYLIKNLRKLKYMNLSKISGIDGSFLSGDCGDTQLETLILRDCNCLKAEQVLVFWDSLLGVKAHLRFIQHIDISNNRGLVLGDGRYCKPKFCLEEMKKQRPSLTFVADFISPTFPPSFSSSLGDTSFSGSGTN